MRETRSRFKSVCILVALMLLLPLFAMNVSADQLPNPPKDVMAVASNGKVTITWAANITVGGLVINGYTIWRGEGTVPMAAIAVVSPSPCRYEDTSVINGHTYFYKICANNNSVGPGDFSSPIVNATPLNVPSSPTAAFATPELGQMLLNWKSPYNDGGSPVLNYRIY